MRIVVRFYTEPENVSKEYSNWEVLGMGVIGSPK